MAEEKTEALVQQGGETLAGLVKSMMAKPDLVEPSSGLPWGVLVMSLAQSSYVNDRTLADVITKVVAGREMGLTPFQSCQHLYLIPGTDRRPAKVGLESIVRAAKIRASGVYDYEVVTSTAQECSIEFYRTKPARRLLGTSTFTIAQARKAGLPGRGGAWAVGAKSGDEAGAYDEDMLFNRAMSRGQKRYCPDVLGGITTYDPAEVDEIDERERERAAAIDHDPPTPAIPPELRAEFARLGWTDAKVTMWLATNRGLTVEQQAAKLEAEWKPKVERERPDIDQPPSSSPPVEDAVIETTTAGQTSLLNF